MHKEEITLVQYLGRAVPKHNFRTYIFASDGRKKLVESYDEFDLFIHSDGWFATKEDAEAEATKKSRKKSEG